MKRQLHLNLFIHSRGHHEASWRHPLSSPLALTDIRYYQDLAQRAEAGLFDSIFLADQLALGDDASQAARTWLEPVTVLAAVAAVTTRIGLIATASTTYTEPFNLARQFGSLDHISNGRVGWNIVTSWLATAARNFGGTGQVSHDDRYARGEEFMTVVKALWDSWADDAILDDRANGAYARADRIRPIDHRIVGPAVPQRLDHAHELLAARIAVCVAYLGRTAEVARCRGKPRRHDVPAHATVADVVQRSELACEIERLGIGGRRRGNHSDPVGRHRHRREHGDGLKPGTRRLVHIIAQRELVGQEDRIEQACFCPLRQILVVADVGQRQRRGSWMPPRCFMVPAAMYEQVQMQLLRHGTPIPVQCLCFTRAGSPQDDS